MGRWRSWLRKLERSAEDEAIVIPQQDGSIARFPKGTEGEAFVHEAKRMKAIYRGEEPGPPHALTVARRNALHPQEHAVFDADRQPRRTLETPDAS
jgi:hypothetical protein